MKLKLIISAVSAGHGGAGDYLGYIRQSHKDYQLLAPFVFPHKPGSVVHTMLYKVQVFAIKRVAGILARMKLIESVVFHHPQTLGYKLSGRLLRSAKQVDYWVVDTSFFCKQSYNYRNGKSCFKCVAAFAPDVDCQHFPISTKDEHYLGFLRAVNTNSKKYIFMCRLQGMKSF